MGNVWRTIFAIARPAIVLSYHRSPNVLGINAANLQMLKQYRLNDHLIIVSVAMLQCPPIASKIDSY